MGDLLRIMEAVDTGVDVETFPRAMFQASLELGEFQQERDQTQPHAEWQLEGIPQGERQERATEQTPERRQQDPEDAEAQQRIQFPKGPRPKRPNPDSPAYGGWDVLDAMNVEQCGVSPPGMQTIEYIPNSLQEDWTEAWNSVHMLRQAAVTEEEKDRAMKWILWLPHGCCMRRKGEEAKETENIESWRGDS